MLALLFLFCVFSSSSLVLLLFCSFSLSSIPLFCLFSSCSPHLLLLSSHPQAYRLDSLCEYVTSAILRRARRAAAPFRSSRAAGGMPPRTRSGYYDSRVAWAYCVAWRIAWTTPLQRLVECPVCKRIREPCSLVCTSSRRLLHTQQSCRQCFRVSSECV